MQPLLTQLLNWDDVAVEDYRNLGAEIVWEVEDWLEQCRRVYNYALAERKAWYKSHGCQINACSLHSEYIIPADAPRPTYASQCKNLTAAKEAIPALKEVQSQVLQQTWKRLEQAFVSIWERNFGFPQFKQPGRMKSFVFPQFGKNPWRNGAINLTAVCRKNQSPHICLPKIGWSFVNPEKFQVMRMSSKLESLNAPVVGMSCSHYSGMWLYRSLFLVVSQSVWMSDCWILLLLLTGKHCHVPSSS